MDADTSGVSIPMSLVHIVQRLWRMVIVIILGVLIWQLTGSVLYVIIIPVVYLAVLFLLVKIGFKDFILQHTVLALPYVFLVDALMKLCGMTF